MLCSNDLRFVDQRMVDRGLACAVPSVIRLDRYYTDEEKAANRALAEKLRAAENSEAWIAHCDREARRIGAEIFALIEAIEKRCAIGQFRKPDGRRSERDDVLWFWCNTVNGERDYSYVTLSFMDGRQSAEERTAIVNDLLRLFEIWPGLNIQAHIQYATQLDEAACRREADRIYNASRGKFVTYCRCEGRLFRDEQTGEYYFRRKRARKYSHMPLPVVCNCVAGGTSA